MLDRLGVPLLIPPTLPELESLRKAPNVEDGPGVVCSVRNAIVHAGDSSEEKKGRTPEVIYQAWVLGQWYLELAVLAILEYRGQYSNRTRRTRYSHEVENVPWAG